MLSLKECARREERSHIQELEQRVWTDIFHARRSFALIDIFLADLERVCEKQFLGRSAPIINALWNASIDSIIISLGRLLNPTAKGKECTIAIYRSKVINYLDEHGPDLNESFHAKESVRKLKDKKFIRELRKRQEAFEKQIMPWRNKVTAHSEIDTLPSFPKNFNMVISYLEDVHKICHSAMEDAGGPGLYSTDQFKKASDYWCERLKRS
jgi:hypothetical protein